MPEGPSIRVKAKAKNSPKAVFFAEIAQLVEHLHGKEKVVGSNPILSLIFLKQKH